MLPAMRLAFLIPAGLALCGQSALLAEVTEAETLPPEMPAQANLGPALGVGEKLVFQASWKVFSRVGRITVSADDAPMNAPAGNESISPTDEATSSTVPAAPARRIRVDVSSDGVIAHLYTYRATGESLFDPITGRMISARYTAAAGKRREDRSIRFDSEENVAYYRDALVPKRDADIPLPAGEPLDLITCLVTARRWNLKPGDTRDVVVLADKKFYPIRLRADLRETIKTPLGTFSTLLIVPEPVGTPRGVFRKGGGMRIWIEDSPQALPLRVEIKGPVGTVNVDLIEYEPPLELRGKPGAESLREVE